MDTKNCSYLTVLGTSFNIRAYKNDPFKEVAVVSGKVKVSLNHNTGEKKEIKSIQ